MAERTDLTLYRNSDVKVTYSLPEGYNLAGFSPAFYFRTAEGESPTLSVTSTPTGNGSSAVVQGDAVVLVVKAADASLFTSQDIFNGVYDSTLTKDGFVNRFVGGPMTIYVDGSYGEGVFSDSVFVSLSGIDVPVIIEGGNLGTQASDLIQALDSAVDAAQAAASAAQGYADEAQAATAGKADISGANISDPDEFRENIGAIGFNDIDLAIFGDCITQVQRVMEGLKNDDRDLDIVIAGDSTGRGFLAWAYRVATGLAPDWPAFGFEWREYTPGSSGATGTYGSTTVIQIGTGSHKVRFWNASVDGAIGYYLAGQFFDVTVGDIQPDLLFVNYGHNGDNGGVLQPVGIRQVDYISTFTNRAARELPGTPIILIGQNPVIPNDSMATKTDAIRGLADGQGFGYIDIHGAFRQAGVPLTDLMFDNVHPNITGYQLWADVVLRIFQYRSGSASGPGRQGKASPVICTGSHFAHFSRGWTVSGTAVMTRTTTLGEYETYGQATVLTASGGAGWIYRDLVTLDNVAAYQGKTVTLTVRVKVAFGQPVAAARIRLDDGINTIDTADGGQTGDEFYDQVVTMKIAPNATRIRALIFASENATATSSIIDRYVLGETNVPVDVIPVVGEVIPDLRVFGSDSGPLVALRNTASGTQGFAFLSTATGTDQDDPATQWQINVAGDIVRIKQRGDSGSRIEIYPNGYIYFGTGTGPTQAGMNQVNANTIQFTDATLYPSANNARDLGLSSLTWRYIFAGTAYYIGTTQVVGPRDTGWTAMTGTGSKGAMAAAPAGTANAAYVQADFQTALDRIAALEARMKSYDAALIGHGLIGP